MSHAPYPPFRVLAPALRHSTERLAQEISRPCDRAPDWNEFEWAVARAVAVMQGISVTLADSLRWRGPESWQAFLAHQCEQSSRRSEKIAELLARIDETTRRHSIAVVALKGSALRTLGLWRLPFERPMGDVDLLVRPQQLDALARAMSEIDYEHSYAARRHVVFKRRGESTAPGIGEQALNPVPVEVHTRISEALPATHVDITGRLWPEQTFAGIHPYASKAALMCHLLLHCAGNMRAHAMRLSQLRDVALLAARMTTDDWDELLDDAQPWWMYPPLHMSARYFPGAIPPDVLEQARWHCPAPLCWAAERALLTTVSWSNLRIDAFPGIEWSRTPLEALRYAKSRILPGKVALDELRSAQELLPRLGTIPWYGQRHFTRIVRWLFTRPPRVQTLRSVLDVLADEQAKPASPTVSVILPVFNRLAFLRAAVASVFEQTFSDWELVIADDGSDEETKTWLRSIEKPPRVRVTWLSHTGNPAAVRNAAMRQALGEFVAFLDSDDEWHPDKLAKQVEMLRERPQNRWCCSPVVHIDANGNVLPRRSRARHPVRQSVAFEQIARWETAIAMPTVMVDRRLVERVGGFDERALLHEDYDLWLKLARESEVSVHGAPLARVRHHDSHYSKTGEPEIRDWIEFFARWQHRVTEPGLKRVVERQGARCTAMLARHYATQGDFATVLRIISRGANRWTCPEWWVGSAIALTRLLVPSGQPR